MGPSSISPFYVVFIFSLLTALQFATPTEIRSDDIINQTCKTCTKTTPSNFSYDFCSASLAAVPVSHVTNLPGLGLISLELALINATNTQLTISSMLSKNESNPHCNSCLEACLQLYSDMSAKLEECVVDFMSGEHNAVYIWVSAIMQATTICEGVFKGKGHESPLTMENYSLSQLCGIVLCIIDLVSPISNSWSSDISLS